VEGRGKRVCEESLTIERDEVCEESVAVAEEGVELSLTTTKGWCTGSFLKTCRSWGLISVGGVAVGATLQLVGIAPKLLVFPARIAGFVLRLTGFLLQFVGSALRLMGG